VSYPSDPPRDENGNSLAAPGSRTDWAYLRRIAAEDLPIPYDPNDPDDGPYDPNDDAAVEAYWAEGERLGLVTHGLTHTPAAPATSK